MKRLLLLTCMVTFVEMYAATMEPQPRPGVKATSPEALSQSGDYVKIYPVLRKNEQDKATQHDAKTLCELEQKTTAGGTIQLSDQTVFVPNTEVARSNDLIRQKLLGSIKLKGKDGTLERILWPVELVPSPTYNAYRRSLKCFAAYIGSVIAGGILVYQGIKKGRIKSMVVPGVSLLAFTGYHFFTNKKRLVKDYTDMPCPWWCKISSKSLKTTDAKMLKTKNMLAFYRFDIRLDASSKCLATHTPLDLPILSES